MIGTDKIQQIFDEIIEHKPGRFAHGTLQGSRMGGEKIIKNNEAWYLFDDSEKEINKTSFIRWAIVQYVRAHSKLRANFD